MITEFPSDFLELRESPIKEDIPDIENEMEEFYLETDLEEDESLKAQCLDARNSLDSTRILVRNLLVLEENKYIQKHEKDFKWMLDNLGRVDKRIEKIESDTIEKLETIELMNDRDLPNSPKIRKYLNFLRKCMEHLVYYPLIKSCRYFKEKKLEGRDLFLYWVFVQIYNSSESLGSISAEEIKTHPKHRGISTTKSSHEESEEDIGEEEGFPSPEEIQKEEKVQELIEQIDEEKEEQYGRLEEEESE